MRMVSWGLLAISAMAVRQSLESCDDASLQGSLQAHEHERDGDFGIGDTVMVTVDTNELPPEARGTVVEVPEKGMLYGVSVNIDGVGPRRFEFMANQLTAIEGLEYKGPVAAAARALLLARSEPSRENIAHHLEYVEKIMAADMEILAHIQKKVDAAALVSKYFDDIKRKKQDKKGKLEKRHAFRKDWAVVRNKAKKILVFSMVGDTAAADRQVNSLMSSVKMSTESVAKVKSEFEVADGEAAKARENAELALEMLEEHEQNSKEIEVVLHELRLMLEEA